MKIKIIKSRLLDALKDVQAGANAKKAIEIYGNVKIDAHDGQLELTTTNGEITLHSKTECEVEEADATTLPMRLLLSVVAALPEGEVVIEGKNDTMKVLGGSSRFVVRGIPAANYPKLPSAAAKQKLTIEASALGSMLKKTSYAQSTDETRRTLTSVLLDIAGDKIHAVATDGRRLAIAENQISGAKGDVQYILPTNTVAVLQKFCDRGGEVLIEDIGTQLKFTMDDGKIVVYTLVIDGKYPNYAQVIPKEQKHKAVVDRELLISALERVSVMSITMTTETSVRMTFADNKLVVKVIGDDNNSGTDELPVKYDGEKLEIMFNPRYVIDPLKASVTDDVEIDLTDGSHAATIKVAEEKFLCVLMPLRLS